MAVKPDHHYTWSLGADVLGGGGKIGQDNAYGKAFAGFRLKGDYVLNSANRIGAQGYLQFSQFGSQTDMLGSLSVIDFGVAAYKHFCAAGIESLCLTPLIGVQVAAMAPSHAADLERPQRPDEIADGRFVLGLGNGTRRMIADWHGQDPEAPALRMEELVGLVRVRPSPGACHRRDARHQRVYEGAVRSELRHGRCRREPRHRRRGVLHRPRLRVSVQHTVRRRRVRHPRVARTAAFSAPHCAMTRARSGKVFALQLFTPSTRSAAGEAHGRTVREARPSRR